MYVIKDKQTMRLYLGKFEETEASSSFTVDFDRAMRFKTKAHVEKMLAKLKRAHGRMSKFFIAVKVER